MITRISSFYDVLGITGLERERAEDLAHEAGIRAEGMTHNKDYNALAAVLLYCRPKKIFEIGTYMGVTSDFFMELLPACQVVSIAYVPPLVKRLSGSLNNVDLSKNEIGSKVRPGFRDRFTQLIGDSHKIDFQEFVAEHGKMDMVFVDGDHSFKGVKMDTELAARILNEMGVICWHDANPKPAYEDVRRFLETMPERHAIATQPDFVGGIAAWSSTIEEIAKARES